MIEGGVLGSRNLRRLFLGYGVMGVISAVMIGGLAVSEVLSTPDAPTDPEIEFADSGPAGAELDVSGIDDDVIVWVQPTDLPADELRCTTEWPSRGVEPVEVSDESVPPGWEYAADSEGTGEYSFVSVVYGMTVSDTMTCTGDGIEAIGVTDDKIIQDYEGDKEYIPQWVGVSAFALVTGLISLVIGRRISVEREGARS